MDATTKGRVIIVFGSVLTASACMLFGNWFNTTPFQDKARVVGSLFSFYACCGGPLIGVGLGWIGRSALLMRQPKDL